MSQRRRCSRTTRSSFCLVFLRYGSVTRRKDRPGFDRVLRGDREEQEPIGELQCPDPRVVPQHVLVIEPANPSFDDDAVLVERREHMGNRFPEVPVELSLQEPYELVAASNDMTRLHRLEFENDVGMDDLTQLLERMLCEELEVAPRETLALDNSCCRAFRDVREYEPPVEKRPLDREPTSAVESSGDRYSERSRPAWTRTSLLIGSF